MTYAKLFFRFSSVPSSLNANNNTKYKLFLPQSPSYSWGKNIFTPAFSVLLSIAHGDPTGRDFRHESGSRTLT